jgi:catechol 2,3-dioxygenase-like lactoylglutathione lyase family enzyme
MNRSNLLSALGSGLIVFASGLVLPTAPRSPHSGLGTAVAPAAPSRTRDAAIPVRAVLGVASTVADLDSATRFYVDVFDARVLGVREEAGEAIERRFGLFPCRVRAATLAIGSERFELEQFLAPAGRARAATGSADDPDFLHLAIVVRDMDGAYARLRAAGVESISSAPQRLPDWNVAAAGIRAFYFRDRDGHPLELLSFPEGKGDPRLRDDSSRTFTGIDHAAFAVRDASVASSFYVDLLGLRVVGRSENFGIEQERLNGVFGSRVAIVGARAKRGFGVEFLDYVAPRERGPIDPLRSVADSVARRLVFQVDDADAAFDAARAAGVSLLSARCVEAVDPTGASMRTFVARDPDGRFVEFRGPSSPEKGEVR